jgi:hypothetical protein
MTTLACNAQAARAKLRCPPITKAAKLPPLLHLRACAAIGLRGKSCSFRVFVGLFLFARVC